MRKFCLSALFAISAFALTAPPCAAQIVIPDVNKDTIGRVPAPGGDRLKTGSQGTSGDTVTPLQKEPDPRCIHLSEALRRTTPGCK